MHIDAVFAVVILPAAANSIPPLSELWDPPGVCITIGSGVPGTGVCPTPQNRPVLIATKTNPHLIICTVATSLGMHLPRSHEKCTWRGWVTLRWAFGYIIKVVSVPAAL